MYILTFISALTISLGNVKQRREVSKCTNTTNVINVEAEREGGECEDDVYKDCQRRVEAGACTGEAGTENPHREVRLALAECRQSCQELIQSEPELPSIIQLYGGIEVGQIANIFQYLPWTNLN